MKGNLIMLFLWLVCLLAGFVAGGSLADTRAQSHLEPPPRPVAEPRRVVLPWGLQLPPCVMVVDGEGHLTFEAWPKEEQK